MRLSSKFLTLSDIVLCFHFDFLFIFREISLYRYMFIFLSSPFTVHQVICKFMSELLTVCVT